MLIEALTPSLAEPETSRPDAEKVLAGDPVHTTWNVEDDRGLYCGIWQSTPGKWRISYDEWEYCRIHEGHSVIAGDDGSRLEVGPGDAFVIRPGFTGTWEVLEATRKDYVILMR
ncbi:cupin domain-containing protein [Sinirhodobacter sp. WL0062]|uniref:Cupin domain-containing protein n=1 Tax=Rhodobacter flavimaris TaxID=2907145 RepID=A0ABS8Z0L5_9RHOB|nr:cupin domain-containing protein [Sinirhodobacter sp. WL0062]MCE5973490.1 cupin domain-containing protein [Sinirhodobacter sp. WL0062]